MSAPLQDVWLPEVEAEYTALLRVSRDVGVEVGNQFRAFERIIERGVDAAWRPIDLVGSAAVYVMSDRHALMFFAVAGSKVAVVKWTTVGTEYEQRLAREDARRRAEQQFSSS